FLDYVIRRFSASPAELRSPRALDLRWNRRLTRSPGPSVTLSQPYLKKSRSNSGFSVPRRTGLRSTIHPISALMMPPQLPNLTESPAIAVAIVCEPETIALADSLEIMLAEAKGFTYSRFEYRAESGFKPHEVGFANPDVVVAIFD